MQLVSPAEKSSSTRSRATTIVFVCAVIVVAWLIMRQLGMVSEFLADGKLYYDYAAQLLKGNIAYPLFSIRQYGYPAFLIIGLKISEIMNLTPVMAMIGLQFVFHIGTAFLGMRIFQRLYPTAHPWLVRAVFAVVMCNPFLLASVTQMLTESLTTFFVTAFFYTLQSEFMRHKALHCILAGLLLGMSYLLRPFHLVWGMSFLLGSLVLYGVVLWQRGRSVFLAQHIKSVVMIIAGFTVMMLSHTAFLYLCSALIGNQVDIAKLPSLNNNVISIYLGTATFFYRYEAYRGVDMPLTRLQYINPRLYVNSLQPELLLMPLFKTVNLFQQHDYNVYRRDIGVTSFTAFGWGFVSWAMFCYVAVQTVQRAWQSFRARTAYSFEIIVGFSIMVYVLIYGIILIPEQRFILPIYPMLTALAVGALLRPSRRPVFWAIVLFAAAIYVINFYVIQEVVLIDLPLVSR